LGLTMDSDSNGDNQLDPGERYGIQSGMMVAIFICSFAGVMLPLIMRKYAPSQSTGMLLSTTNCFSAGVLLSVSLVHLLSESNHEFTHIYPDESYPFVFLGAVIGFVMLLILEKGLVPYFFDREVITPTEIFIMTDDEALCKDDLEKDQLMHCESCPSQKRWEKLADIVVAYALLLVLSFHSILEGITLGLITELGALLAVFAAIVAHKALAAFALGNSLAKTQAENSFLFLGLGLAFSAMTPIGILIGMGVETALSDEASEVGTVIAESFCAGTFLYISIIDIVAQEFDEGAYRLQKHIAFVLGVGIMSVLRIWI